MTVGAFEERKVCVWSNDRHDYVHSEDNGTRLATSTDTSSQHNLLLFETGLQIPLNLTDPLS